MGVHDFSTILFAPPAIQLFVNQIPGVSTLLLLEELNNAGIAALSILAVYDATKALAVLR